jgi:hypothetical protein
MLFLVQVKWKDNIKMGGREMGNVLSQVSVK